MAEDEVERLREILKKILVKPPKTYKKGWDAARAEQQRQRCIANKPWKHSTGARTPEGKKIVGQNSRKHSLGHLFTSKSEVGSRKSEVRKTTLVVGNSAP